VRVFAEMLKYCTLQFLASELDLARSVLIRTGLATLPQHTSSQASSTVATRGADNALKPIRATTNITNASYTTAQTGKVRLT
jgi:hypothetical protein